MRTWNRDLPFRQSIGIAVVCALMLSVLSSLAAPTSENNPRLKGAFKKFPAADTNGDGILTMAEAMAYKAKARGSQRGAQRQGRVKGPLQPRTVSGSPTAASATVKGYNGLYMGHSFFRPSATELLNVIPDTSIVNHTECIVMQGGQGGSPGFLWDHAGNRDRGQQYLDSGDVDLLVMTYYSPADSGIEHYSKWFDYAISRNPQTTFMVTIPWGKDLYRADRQELVDKETRIAALYDALIVDLRRKYPENRILYCPYGLGVYELIARLSDGKLPGVEHVLNPDKQARAQSKQNKDQLLNDELGHGGALVGKLGALLWLQTLYDYDMSTLKPQTVSGLPDIDLNEIAAKVHKRIAPFNAR
jgi:hypothetical protein